MEAKVSDLLQRQQQIVDAMENLFTNFKKDPKERKTSDYLARRWDALENLWKEFEKNHDLLIQQGISGDYIEGNHFEQARKFYSQAVDVIKHTPAAPLIKPGIPLGAVNTGASRSPLNPTHTDTENKFDNQRNVNPQDTRPFTPSVNKDTNKVDEMLRKQTSNFKAFHRTLKNITLAEIKEKWEFDDILKNIESRWATIDKLHWDIDSELGPQVDESYENVFTEYESLYNDMKRQINSKLWSAAHRENSTPKLDIPIFHGNYQQWTSFKDLFTEAIHSNPCLSNAQKMQFLKSKIKGEPERLIQHLPISSENYITCWEIINHRYNNKKLIFSNHMNTIMSLPAVQQVSSTQIKRIHDVTVECLNGIKNLGVNVDTWDPILIHILAQKLDSETHNDYMASLKEPRELPTLKDFLQFLETKFTTLESSKRKQENAQQKPASTPSSSNQSRYKNYYSSNKATSNKFQREKQITCPVCAKDHGIYFCNEFRDMTPAMKKKTITRLELCSNCLYSHKGKPCRSTKQCRQCNGSHNTLLHDAFTQQGTVESTPSTSNSTHVAQQNAFNEILLATALVQVRASDGVQHTLRALIDQGSQVSLITEKALQKLKLGKRKSNGLITGIGTNDNVCKGVTNITCSSMNGNFTFDTEVFIMKSLTRNLPHTSFTKPSWNFLNDLQLADPEFYISKPIDILLGAEVYTNILLDRVKRGEHATPIAQETQLGWILCGKAQSLQCNVVLTNLEDLQKFWEIEDISNDRLLSSEEEECVKFYNSTTKRLKDGKYQVRLPLKTNSECELGQSKNKAIAQFQHLERKFSKQKIVAAQYKDFIDEYLSLGHMKPAAAHGNKKPDYYLPHHCVLHESSTTTKFRVVFNGSAKTSSGKSLNDLMHKGPNLQKDLMDLILRWRQHRVAFVADLEKMFRQLWVHPEDQALQKIVWRDSPHQLLQEYQLTTVTYGTKAAPFLAMMTLKQLAFDERSNYPEASQVVEHCFYMDDLLHGADNLEIAQKLKQDLIQLMKSGGFNLRKWRSNHEGLLQNNNKVECDDHNYEFKQPESMKTLGLSWEPTQDMFTFQANIGNDCDSSITKRKLLSEISKLFDPLGWLTPVSTQMKLLFQNVWKSNIQWDDKLPDDISKEWLKIKENIPQIKQVKIPRWLGTETGSDIELHGFCDSSQKAYACVIYCKIENKLVLLAGKSRLVPCKKNITLPKLELSGAHLLAKLMEKVRQSLGNRNIKMYGWVDSTAVLGWIQGDPARWKTFVANRVQQITAVMPAIVWRYVKSEENPADSASRGLTASQLLQHPLWWQGPEWLSSFNEKGEENRQFYTTNEEVKKQVNTAQHFVKNEQSTIQEMLNKYSSFTKIVHVLAWILRFMTRKQERRNESYLTLTETRQAKTKIIIYIQQQEFQEEIDDLKQGKQVSRKSKLSGLNPFLCENGLLRVGGRLRHANINPEMKHPIILPHSGRLTEMIITHAHLLTYHGGARVTHAFIRQKYWIIGGNNATKKHIRRCITCKKQKPERNNQLMGDLPEARINPSRPFLHTGVDFTGHVFIKANKGRGIKTTKGYVAVFVCMATKAVHLELVSDMTTSAFIAAIRRMAARRGAPRHMYSDNGRNFVGASRCLQQEYQEILQSMDDEFLSEMTDMEIVWHFNAPSWPSAGGLWEAAVKSFKFHLKRVIGEQKLTYEEFTTLLAQIEACLNSRPLTTLTEDPQDLDYLTPAHFLAGGPTLTLIETERDERTRWKLTQNILQDLWKRWRSEYLMQLAARSKWKQPQRNIEVNDIVLIHDDNLPPGKWAMGRVIELHQGKDGYVRVVTVKTKTGIMKRPVVKLSVLLEKQENASSNCVTVEQPERQTSDVISAENSKPKTNATPNKKLSISSITTALLLFLSLISTSHCNANVTQFKEHQSLYFDKISDMMLIRDEWKLVVYYDLDPYWKATRAFNKYTEFLQGTCDKIREQAHCDVILLQLQHGFSELEYYNQMLLTQHTATRPTRQRRRRGLINGIGSIAHSLFGVLDESFAEQYHKDIALIRQNQNHIASLWKNQTSIIEAEYNLIKRAENSMDKQHKLINQHMNIIDKNLNRLESEIQVNNIITSFNMGSTIASNMIHNLKEIQTMLLDTITDIYHGRFNLHLLTPNQLINELSIISSKLPKDVSLPIDNIHTDLNKIYDLLTVKTRLLEDVLIFEIKIPLISRDVYEILKIIPVPVAKEENMISIQPVSSYISINMKKDVFTPLSEYDIKSCLVLAGVYYCQLLKPEFQMKGDRSFCKNNYSTCRTLVNPCQDDWKETSIMNTYLYFCCNTCQVRTICDNQVTAYQLSHAGLIHIAQGCIVKTSNFTVFPHKIQFTELRMKPDIYAPNIAPINRIINLTIPMAAITKMNESHEFQREMMEIGQNIRKLKEADIISTDISYHDIHHYVVSYVIVGIMVTVGIMLTIKKMKCSWRVPPTSSEASSATSGHPRGSPAARAPPAAAQERAPAAARPRRATSMYARVHSSRIHGIQIPNIFSQDKFQERE